MVPPLGVCLETCGLGPESTAEMVVLTPLALRRAAVTRKCPQRHVRVRCVTRAATRRGGALEYDDGHADGQRSERHRRHQIRHYKHQQQQQQRQSVINDSS